MTQNTLTYVKGVVRCEDLEAMLFAAAAPMQLRIRLDTIPEYEEEDDYDQEYEDYLDYLDYQQQSYD